MLGNSNIGASKVGFSSIEAPSLPSVGGESLKRVGIGLIGTYNVIPYSKLLKSKGKIRGSFYVRYLSKGALTTKAIKFMRVSGSLFANTIKTFFKFSGSIATLREKRMLLVGAVSNPKTFLLAFTGLSGKGAGFNYKSIGLLLANYNTRHCFTALIRQKKNAHLNCVGVLQANFAKLIQCIGLMGQRTTVMQLFKGVYAHPYTALYTAKGIVKQIKNIPLTMHGDLANTRGFSRVVYKGVLNVAAFVASVPKRTQDFVTNKRWFD